MEDVPYQKDRTLLWTCFRLDRLPPGLRLFPMKVLDAKHNGSALLIDTHLALSE